MRGLINTGAIKTLASFEEHARCNPDYKGLYKDILSDLVDCGAVVIDAEGNFILGESPIWHSADPLKAAEYVPDLSKSVCRRGNLDRSNPDSDKFLSFGFVMNFPDDPEVSAKLKLKLSAFAESLRELSKECHKVQSAHPRMITLSVASAFLKPEDL